MTGLRPDRRSVLTGSLAAAGSLLTAGCTSAGQPPASAAEKASTGAGVPSTGTHLVTLGTAAGPTVRSRRQGIATAVVVDGHLYVVDCGLGVVRQLSDADLPVDRLRTILLTHLHSDHIAELPAMLLYNWNSFTEPFEVIGPASAGSLPEGARPVVSPPTPGTRELVNSILDGYAYEVNLRVFDVGRPPLGDLVQPREIQLPPDLPAGPHRQLAPRMDPVEVYADDRVRVLVALVDHPPVFPSYGYRIETPDGVIALSGDTSEHSNVVTLAQEADVLVHESVYLDYYRDRGRPPKVIDHHVRSHTEPAGTGRVAHKAGARHLVLSHLAGIATDEQWTAPARQEYGGPITVASDGQIFSL